MLETSEVFGDGSFFRCNDAFHALSTGMPRTFAIEKYFVYVKIT